MTMIRKVFCVFVIIIAGLTRGDSVRVTELDNCPVVSISDSILGCQNSVCELYNSYDFNVIEGNEEALQKALHLVRGSQNYVAVLFYASWCPFSTNFRPSFSILSTLYPSIPHLAIEESAVKPSILSKHGIHGLPAIFLLNATMRVRYRGSRSLSSLVHFYSDVTGMEGDPRELVPFDKIERASNQRKNDDEMLEDSHFAWARSLENLVRQEPYLVLATLFVFLRLMCLVVPYLLEFARCTWRNFMQHVRVTMLWEHPLRYLNKTKQVICSFKVPRKGSNFQEGAINARAWASKSLASAVSATSSASH